MRVLNEIIFREECYHRGLWAAGNTVRSQVPTGLLLIGNAAKLPGNTTAIIPPRARKPYLGERSQKEGILSHVALKTGTTGSSVRQAERPWVVQASHGFQLAISPQQSWSER